MALHTELIDQLTHSVGHRIPLDGAAHFEYASVDTVRLFTRSYGDANPRYSTVAPPLFPLASGSASSEAIDDVMVALWRAVRSVPARIAEDRWTFGPAVPLGTRLLRDDTIAAVVPGPPTVVTVRSCYAADGADYARHERDRVYGERSSAEPETARSRAAYTHEQIAAIEAQYGRHRRHRSRTDDNLGPLVKGPLTITDLVTYRAGIGPGPFGVEPLELAPVNRARRPHFYDRDPSGMWDARERLHYDDSYAQSQGHPSAYDYSHTRLVWACQLITDWLDDGHELASLTYRELAHNYTGDTTWLTGHVVRSDEHGAELRYEALNQLDAVTACGAATVRWRGGRGRAS